MTKKLLTGMLGMMILAGCAGTMPTSASVADPATAVPTAYPTAYPTSGPMYPDPSTGPTPLPYPAPGNSYDPTGSGSINGATTLQPLLAHVDSVKKSFLGLTKAVATVTVSNPAMVTQSGTLTVTITNDGSALQAFTDQIDLPAGQSVTKQYELRKFGANDATAVVTTQPAATGTSAYDSGSSAYGMGSSAYGTGSYSY